MDSTTNFGLLIIASLTSEQSTARLQRPQADRRPNTPVEVPLTRRINFAGPRSCHEIVDTPRTSRKMYAVSRYSPSSHMLQAILRARRLVWTWALAAGLTTWSILTFEGTVEPMAGLIHPNVWMSAFMGLLVSACASPLLTARWMRWYWGSLIGVLIGAAIIFAFFFANPHEWQPSRWDAWKSVALFLDVYYFVIIPASLLAGAVGTLSIQRDEHTTG